MQIEVFGEPASQGSKRVYNGRVVEVAGPKLKVWRKAIADACIAAREGNNTFFTGAVKVEVTFYLPRPKTVTREKRQYPTVPIDIDKACRGLLDGIGQSQMIWQDDAQVIVLHATKLYADDREPGATIRITPL